MLGAITGWLAALWQNTFGALFDLMGDVLVAAFSALLSAVASVFSSIPAPAFMSTGLGALFGGLAGGILYLLGQVGFFQAVATIGAGYGFRFLRKVVTLFQW